MSAVGRTPVAAVLRVVGAGRLVSGRRGDVRQRARALFGGAGEADPEAGWRAWLRGEGVRKWCAGRLVEGEAGRRWSFGRWGDCGREIWCLPAGLVAAVTGRSVLPVLASVVAFFLVRRWLTARGAAHAREGRSAAVIGLCAAVAGELRAGRQPAQALLAAGAPGLGAAGSAVMAAARYGGDVPRELRAAARLPGAGGLAGMAACWQVAVEGGAGLASGLERIAAGLRSQREQRDDLRAQLAGPRATALMLALLPAGGLLMGSALGADPLRVLLHTPAGWGCLAAGGLLEWCGVTWTARIVAAAEAA
ncbi:type II secretion system F family protein [Streptomyces sp. CA2R101]|uniref:type II secretion system F family protein n=1 Tax=Streptomyces sp. CA2R101 TaxID=3120152 RepID=UPI003007FAE6